MIRALTRALDAVPHGVLVVSSELRIRYLNRTACDALARNRGIGLRNDSLAIVDKLLDQRLHELVAPAVEKGRQGHDHASGGLFINAPMSRERIELIIAPVPDSAARNGEPDVLIYLFDADSPRQVSFDVLTGIYGLTQTEAKLTQLMTNGMTLDDAAEKLQISINTARTHLKHIFHKTGSNRQTELLHRIECGPASLLIGSDGAQLEMSGRR